MSKELLAAIRTDPMLASVWPRIGLAGYRGSIAHGTAGDILDDVDVGGIFIAPIAHYYGLSPLEHVERVNVASKYDFALFEIRKYFRLLLKSNPNVLSLLWLPSNLYIIRTAWGDRLIAHRSIFISKVVYKTFGGYAHAQLHRMTRLCTKQAYQGSKRRERFKQFGYDCKNAAHLIRLLRMGIEALTTGELNIARHDARELKAIKRGEWTLHHIRTEADRLQKLLDEAFVKSELRARPDYRVAENLLMSILRTELPRLGRQEQ